MTRFAVPTWQTSTCVVPRSLDYPQNHPSPPKRYAKQNEVGCSGSYRHPGCGRISSPIGNGMYYAPSVYFRMNLAS